MEMIINGRKINYEDVGEGPVVLMLHGWGCQIDTFRGLIENLKENYRVITLDFPGFGESDFPESDWGVIDFMKIVRKFLMALNLTDINIIAHSFGARVAILLASTYPNIVNKIVITGGAGLRPRRSLSYYSKIYTFKFLKEIANSKILKERFPEKISKLEKNLKEKYGSKDYRDLDDNMRSVFVNIVNENLRKYLKKIKAPTLLIWGENDKETPIYMGKIMERKIPDAGLVVLEGAGHFAFIEQLPYFTKITKTFFES